MRVIFQLVSWKRSSRTEGWFPFAVVLRRFLRGGGLGKTEWIHLLGNFQNGLPDGFGISKINRVTYSGMWAEGMKQERNLILEMEQALRRIDRAWPFLDPTTGETAGLLILIKMKTDWRDR